MAIGKIEMVKFPVSIKYWARPSAGKRFGSHAIRRFRPRSMMMGAKLLDYPPQYLRGRAKQTRAMAGATSCEATLVMLEERAAEYDRMAEFLEGSGSPLRRKTG